jgi:hypothetical protein
MIIKEIRLVVIDKRTNKIVEDKIVKVENLSINELSKKISLEIAKLRKIYPCKLYYIDEGVFDNFSINDYYDFYYYNFYSDKA